MFIFSIYTLADHNSSTRTKIWKEDDDTEKKKEKRIYSFLEVFAN